MTQEACLTHEASRRDCPELDTFRGIAALLMIFNHAGFRLLSPTDATTGSSGAAVFIGSFAPVLFFFATGFGIALSRVDSRALAVGSLVWKVALLLIADQFFAWKNGWNWGFDFFSFIALSTVVVTLISRLHRFLAAGAVLILLLLGARYGIGPIFRDQFQQAPLVSWMVGVNGVDHVSYPLAPWLVYPLLGFLTGSLYRRDLHVGSMKAAVTAVQVAVGSLAIALGLAVANSIFFRWGTMSLAFFVLSVGVLATAILIAGWFNKQLPSLAAAVALRGVASFAVIPLHYVMLDACLLLMPVPVDPWIFFCTTVAVAWVSLALAAALADQVGRRKAPASMVASLGVVLLLLVLAANRYGTSELGNLGVASICFAGQLAVACLLGMSPRRKPRIPATA